MSFSLSSGSVLIGGSRALVAGDTAWIACQAFVQAVLFDTPLCVHAGCASGADAAAVLAFGAGCCQARVFAAFDRSGAGSWSGSAVDVVQSFDFGGGSVSWLAGGSLAVPLIARLMSRSVAALRGCSAAVFFQPGRGSLKVARHALRSGVPVLVSCAGLSVAPVLPVAPVLVSWLGFDFWLFAPDTQAPLF